ncbi:MAG: HAD family hydrolase [Candidatus Methylumidiphilus sp.]
MTIKSPRIVSFDIDNTLVDFLSMLHASLGIVGQSLASLGGTALTSQQLQALRHEAADDPSFAGATLETLRRESFRRAALSVGLDPDAHVDDLWQLFLDSREPYQHLYPDVAPTLQTLKNQGIRVVAASNGNTPLRESPLADYFEAWFYAGEMGVAKPAIGFYQEAILRLSVKPEEIVHVGDSLAEDYLPAKACGMEALLIQRGNALPDVDTVTIANLHELHHFMAALSA